MTYFKLDIPKVNESISRYKEIKSNCLEDIDLVYRGLGYTESGWNDPNAYTFIEKTKRDKYKIKEYFSYLDNLYNEINQFKTNIDDICNKQGYKRNTLTLKFDDSDIDMCKKYLDNAIILLNNSLNKINISDFKLDFEYLNLVYNLRSEIKSINKSVTDLLDNISSFTNSINNEIYNSKYRLKRIANFDFNLKTSDYKWKVADIDTNAIKKVNNEIYFEVKGTQIENKIKDSELNRPVTSYNPSQTEINIEKAENVKGLNNNLNSTLANQKDIEFEDSKQVQGLNNNLNGALTNQTEIQFEEEKAIQGLNNNLNSTIANQNEIEFEEEKTIQGLNENLNSVTTTNSAVTFETQKVNDLNNNIESVKTNNTNINYNIGNAVNVSNNIVNAKVNQANIDASNIVSKNYDVSYGIEQAEVKSTGITADISKTVNIDTNIRRMESLKDLDKK